MAAATCTHSHDGAHGEVFLRVYACARANTCRTARSDSPTYLSSNSGPLMDRKFAPDSFAIALASSVLPQPGGPKSSTPTGIATTLVPLLSELRSDDPYTRFAAAVAVRKLAVASCDVHLVVCNRPYY